MASDADARDFPAQTFATYNLTQPIQPSSQIFPDPFLGRPGIHLPFPRGLEKNDLGRGGADIDTQGMPGVRTHSYSS